MFEIHIGPQWAERAQALRQSGFARAEAMVERIESPIDLVVDGVNLTGELPAEPAIPWLDALARTAGGPGSWALRFERSPAVLMVHSDGAQVEFELVLVRAPWMVRTTRASVPLADVREALVLAWRRMALRPERLPTGTSDALEQRALAVRELPWHSEPAPFPLERTLRVRHAIDDDTVLSISLLQRDRARSEADPVLLRSSDGPVAASDTRSPIEPWMLDEGTLRVILDGETTEVRLQPGLVATLLADTIWLRRTDPGDPRLRTDVDWHWSPELGARLEDGTLVLLLRPPGAPVRLVRCSLEVGARLLASLAGALAGSSPTMGDRPSLRRLLVPAATPLAPAGALPLAGSVEAQPAPPGRRNPRPIAASSVQLLRHDHAWTATLPGRVVRSIRRAGPQEWSVLTDQALILLEESDAGARAAVIVHRDEGVDPLLLTVDPRGTRSRESLEDALRHRLIRLREADIDPSILAVESVRNTASAGVRWVSSAGRIGVVLDDGTGWSDPVGSTPPLEQAAFLEEVCVGVGGEYLYVRPSDGSEPWKALPAPGPGAWAPATFIEHGDDVWIVRRTGVAEHRWGAESAVWRYRLTTGLLESYGDLATERLIRSADGRWLAGVYQGPDDGWELRVHDEDGTDRTLHRWDEQTFGFDVAWRGRALHVALGFTEPSPVPFQYEHPEIQRVWLDFPRLDEEFTEEEIVGNPVFVTENRMPGTVSLYDDLRLLILDAESGRTIGTAFAFWNDLVWSEIDERGDVLLLEHIPEREHALRDWGLRAHRLQVVGLIAPVVMDGRRGK
jgi:hypothetical protein